MKIFSIYFSHAYQGDDSLQTDMLDMEAVAQSITVKHGVTYVFSSVSDVPAENAVKAERVDGDLILSFEGLSNPILTLEHFFNTDATLHALNINGERSEYLAVQPQTEQGTVNFAPVAFDNTSEKALSQINSLEQINQHTVIPVSELVIEAPILATPVSNGETIAIQATTLMAMPLVESVTPEILFAVDNIGNVQGNLNAKQQITDDKMPVLHGIGTPGDTVEIFDGHDLVGLVKVESDGSWSFTLGLSEGAHALSARVLDNSELWSGDFSLYVDTIAPSRPVMNGILTEEGQPIPNKTTTDNNMIVLSGKGELNTIITIYNNGKAMASVNSDPITGEWQWLPPSGLNDNKYVFTTRSTDFAGNQGLASSPYTVTIDTVPAPTAIAGIVAISEDSGASNSDFITNDTTLVLNIKVVGVLLQGETVQVSLDNGSTWLNATANGNQWYVDNTANVLTEGSHTVLARIVNSKNKAGPVTQQNIVIDTTGPSGDDYAVAINAFEDNVGSKTGDFTSGSSTDDTSPLLKGTVSGLQFGDEVHIYEKGQFIGKATITDGIWSFQLSGLTAGFHDFTAIVVDVAGNKGATSNGFDLIVDPISSIKPVILQAFDDIGSTQGWIHNGAVTDDTQPLINGVGAEPNGVVNIYVNNIYFGSVTADSAGNWLFNMEQLGITLGSGLNTFTAKNVNANGEEGSVSNGFSLHVDNAVGGAASLNYGGLSYDIASAGDFNGDGIEDFIVTAPANQYGKEQAGKSTAYIVYGTSNGLPDFSNGIENITAEQGIKIDASRLTLGDYRNTGIHARGNGDFNGDGYDDIILTSHFEDGAQIIYGRGHKPATIELSTYYDASNTQATRIGWGSGWTGADAAWIDVNNDGYADAVISDSSSNKVYVIYGGENAKEFYAGKCLYMEGNLLKFYKGAELPTGAYTTISNGSISTATSLGDHLNSVGDVNGDGFEDFVLTYPLMTNAAGTVYAGSAFLLFGQQGGLDTKLWTLDDYAKVGIRLNGSEYGELLGDVILDYTAEGHGGHRYGTMNTVSTIGDINGDGISDFIIGSPDWGDAAADGNVILPTNSGHTTK